MSRRIVIEEPCRHDWFAPHKIGGTADDFIVPCPGGSRTVLDPEEWVERASKVLGVIEWRYDAATARHVARAVLESVLDP